MKDDYKFIRKIFKEYKFSYPDLFNEIDAIENETVIWSNTYLEFYPFENALNQLKKPKIYKNKPESNESFIVNKLKENKVYYSYHAENKGWGSVFIIYGNNVKTCLIYSNNDDDEIVLNKVFYISYKNESIIDKILYYMMDEDVEGDKEFDEETFMIDEYLYNKNDKIDSIIRNGFYERKKNVLSTRTFRFDYINDKVLIYSTQVKKNGSDVEELIFTLSER